LKGDKKQQANIIFLPLKKQAPEQTKQKTKHPFFSSPPLLFSFLLVLFVCLCVS
jgi:hypothetical protein